jgi:hypothetical protein
MLGAVVPLMRGERLAQLCASSPGLTPGWNQVLPPSSERCTTCPNQPLVCDA